MVIQWYCMRDRSIYICGVGATIRVSLKPAYVITLVSSMRGFHICVCVCIVTGIVSFSFFVALTIGIIVVVAILHVRCVTVTAKGASA